MKNKVLIIVFFLLLLPIFLFTQSNDIYVSKNGNDTNSCSFFLPCKSFTRATNLVQPGDTIHILKGIYDTPLAITKSGSSKAYISVIGHGAILRGINISGNYIIISNIEIANSISHGIIAGGKYIIIKNSTVHHSVIENGIGPACNTNNEKNGWGSGIKVERGAENITIENNTTYENCGEGIAVTMGKNIVISNNISRDNYSVNIYIDNSSFVTVKNNKAICTGNGYLRDGRRATGIALGEEFYPEWGAQRHDNNILENSIDGCYEGITSWEPDVPGGIEKNLVITGNIIINGINQSISLNWNNQNVLIENNTVDIPIFIENMDGVTLQNNTLIEITQ